MKQLFSYLLLCLLMPCLQMHTLAQEEQRAVWQITRFDLTVNAPATERALAARAVLRVHNVGRGSGSTITLRLSAKAEIKSASAGDATATFRSAPETRGNLQRVTITLPTPVPSDGTVNVALDYRFPVEENSGLTALSPAGSQFLPLALWYPVVNTPFMARGSDTAPFRLTVNNAGGDALVSSGKAAGATYEQTLSGQPFFLTGSWDTSEGTGDAAGISAWLPKGAGAESSKQADELIKLAAAARSFYAGLLGPAPDAPLRLVAVERGAGFSDAGTILLDAAAFRRSKIDAPTAHLIGEAVARLWIGGATPVRGEGAGVIREGLPSFLATLFIEKQYGAEAAEAERQRERAHYAAISRREAALSQMTLLNDTYFTSVATKGAMIWRLVERALGPAAFTGQLRAQLQAGARDAVTGLSLAGLRTALAADGGEPVKAILDQGLDQPTDIDLLVGLPQQRGGQWVSALRNSGSLNVAVKVLATTASGERLTTDATIEARNFGEAVFKTSARIVRVEVDPDKFYPQLDYANDVVPRKEDGEDPLVEASRLFARQDYARTESSVREMLSAWPRMQEARILLARSLLAENKMDEAEREARLLLEERLPTPAALAWANIVLGEAALRRGQAAEAARRFNEAVRADAEYASTLQARQSRIKAEAAASASPAVDDGAQKFIAQLDGTIRSGRKAELESQIVPGELVSFIKGIVGSQPESWQTRVLRTEQLDANRIAADVSINARQFGRDMSGPAVFILRRVGGSWKLSDIQLFEVR